MNVRYIYEPDGTVTAIELLVLEERVQIQIVGDTHGLISLGPGNTMVLPTTPVKITVSDA